MPPAEYAVRLHTGQTARTGPTNFGFEWLIGDGTCCCFLFEFLREVVLHQAGESGTGR
jgi:hypothetical protein